VDISRENRLAQLTTVDQQRELMQYMRGLNEWLERDVHDRQAELRGVAARVDQLRESLGELRESLQARWAEKQRRRMQKDSKMQELRDMVGNIVVVMFCLGLAWLGMALVSRPGQRSWIWPGLGFMA